MTFVGIDNGVTGSIAIILDHSIIFEPTPVVRILNYTKSKQWLHRVNGAVLTGLLQGHHDPFCMIERPLVNPGRWKATMSAVRAMEATMIVLELLQIPYQFIDSREWQKALLPAGLEKEELKKASLDVGKRLFPQVDFGKMKDADGLLIAEYCRRVKSK